MVLFDTSILSLALHPDAKVQDVRDAGARVQHLLQTLERSKERIVIPTPVLAEFLVLAATDGPAYLARIRSNSVFRIEPFDERAAIELAEMEIAARAAGKKRGSAVDSSWQKVKFDRQIVAIAKVHGVRVIYSHDPHVVLHARDCNVNAVSLADLETAAHQLPLGFENQSGPTG